MSATEHEPTAQTPAQLAVRWHGVVAAALLVLTVPLFHLVWHGALARVEPPIVTRSQTARPAVRLPAFADGTWMTAMERHLREASPVTWWLRGSWNETLLHFGIVQHPSVHLGRERWMFHSSTLRATAGRFERESAARRRFFTAARDLVRGAGAELVVSIVPDKARVHPEFAFDSGRLPAGKEPTYDLALAELRDLDIAVVDVAAAMAAARAVNPEAPLYYPRDTHWRPHGALAAGQAAAAVIESLPVAARLQPRHAGELGAVTTVAAVGDLVSMLGLLTCERPAPAGRMRTHPLGLVSLGLLVDREYYAVTLQGETGDRPAVVDDPAAEVLLLGTSFSEMNGAGALALALGRPVRAVIDYGAAGLAPLRAVAAELRAGTAAKVVVWEIVERGLFTVDWARQQL